MKNRTTGRGEQGRRLLAALLALFSISMTTALSAQETDEEIVGTIRFSSASSTTVYVLSFGVGTQYTDTTDREHEDYIPPFLPPGDYLVAFERECTESDGLPPCYFKQDLRAIPDSVREKGLTQFQVNYRLRLRNSTNQGLQLAIRNPDWPRGLDSLRIVDAQLASAFDRTFTGPAVAQVSDPQTSWMNVTAYYNLAVASVDRDESRQENLLAQLANPVDRGTVTLSSELLQSGGRLVLMSPDGRQVLEHDLGTDGAALQVDRLPGGLYHLLRFDRDGEMVEGRSMVIVR